MTIHLTGYEALTEAYYADRNVEVLLHTRFTIESNGRKIPVDPFQALEKVDRWELAPEVQLLLQKILYVDFLKK